MIRKPPHQASRRATPPPDGWISIGRVAKPFGLLGEIRVLPQTFDLDRYKSLKQVHWWGPESESPRGLDILSARRQDDSWYFRFEGFRVPETVRELSGGELVVRVSERLELPEDMVYVSDVIGMIAVAEDGFDIGPIVDLEEGTGQEILVLEYKGKRIHVPWVDAFVKEVDPKRRRVHLHWDRLEGIHED